MLFQQSATVQDTAILLLNELGLGEECRSDSLKILSDVNSRYLKDLKLNLSTALNAESLGKKDAFLLAFSVAFNEGDKTLMTAFRNKSIENGASENEIAEVISCTSLMKANNVYYRFRHFMKDEFYDKTPAGIRMSIMANPVLGKEMFELISLVISAINGCEMCVSSHEKNLVNHGTEKQRIHDAVRLGAVVRSVVGLVGS